MVLLSKNIKGVELNMWTNSWFVGIVGGIISGIIVFFITNFIINKISKKEYFKKVHQVNLEATSLLIMSVSEDKIPTVAVIKALLNSLSRTYNVKITDINTVEATIEDLIKAIFETNYIPIDRKNQLASQLILLIENNRRKETNPIYKLSKSKPNYNLKLPQLRLIITMSISVVTLVLLVKLFNIDSSFLNNILVSDKDNTFSSILLITTVTLSVVVTMMTVLSSMNTKDVEDKLKEEIKKRLNSK